MLRFLLKILTVFAVTSIFFMMGACSDGAERVSKTGFADNKQKKDSLENLNRYLVSQEKEAINEYILNSGVDFEKTGTGLCYRIINQGDSKLIKTGDIIVLDYELRLLNGDLIYSTDESGKKVFVVGHGGVESGLEEAILHLHRGDEAEIIIPSHLAYGLAGDGDRIPIRSTLVYKVKVIENQINK
ncbi:MAG: FKBP-type peptidyl-prolyl cis-trans isomerase [Bacteroidales bacterium]|nr:FKBP-type peptidyl-prolyl cis-trans isomerase [Bacteroidales bacterium]